MSRDRNLEQALKREWRAADAPMTEACLDAETLGAWTDGGLDAPAMAATEAHVSNCARCQALVGTLARTLPAPGTPAPGTRRSWWSQPWLAPIAAAAAAVTIWMVVPGQQERAQAPFDSARVAQDEPPPVVTADKNAVAREPSQPTPRLETAPPPAALRDQSPSQGARGATAPQAATAPPITEPRERQAALSGRKEEAAKRAAAPLGALQETVLALPPEIISPDPRSRWRAVLSGVERSEDGGVSWIPIRAAGDESITGGVAVTRHICWLIGRAGLVLVTVDGVTFARVNLPVRADVASIRATDARSATATTTDGRTFTTTDSGRNWRQN